MSSATRQLAAHPAGVVQRFIFKPVVEFLRGVRAEGDAGGALALGPLRQTRPCRCGSITSGRFSNDMPRSLLNERESAEPPPP